MIIIHYKIYRETSVYRGKKHPYDCFTNLSKDKRISMTALWCPAFGNHG